jgi:hypothetical protein
MLLQPRHRIRFFFHHSKICPKKTLGKKLGQKPQKSPQTWAKPIPLWRAISKTNNNPVATHTPGKQSSGKENLAATTKKNGAA